MSGDICHEDKKYLDLSALEVTQDRHPEYTNSPEVHQKKNQII